MGDVSHESYKKLITLQEIYLISRTVIQFFPPRRDTKGSSVLMYMCSVCTSQTFEPTSRGVPLFWRNLTWRETLNLKSYSKKCESFSSGYILFGVSLLIMGYILFPGQHRLPTTQVTHLMI